MTKEEQIESIQEIQQKYDPYMDMTHCARVSGEKSDYIYSFVETGGYNGGSCWGDEAMPYRTNNKGGIAHIDEILQEISKDISYLKFREIEKNIKCVEYISTDYYGNEAHYDIYYISIEKFLEVLNDG